MKNKICSILGAVSLMAVSHGAWSTCSEIAAAAGPSDLATIAKDIVVANTSGGFNLPMWVTAVDETGLVCQVVNTARAQGTTGAAIGNKSWLGSRVISAQKANTANAFSLDGFSIGTGNLYGLVLEGGSLYGLQHSNPVDASVAYLGAPSKFGTSRDPLLGKRIGGINVFGGGLALYKSTGTAPNEVITKVGAIGVSGDTSCTDHAVAWKIRAALNLDNVPAGFNSTSGLGDTLLIDDPTNLNNMRNAAVQPTCANPPASGATNGVELN